MKPLDEAVEAVVDMLGIDDAAVARRKAFLELTDEDVARLKALHAALQDLAPDIANAFYAHLLRFEETRRFLPVETLERLKRTQSAYFQSLTAGDYGREYIHNRLRVGITHQRIGLALQWYLGAYAKYLVGLLPEIRKRLGNDSQTFISTVQALIKVVLLDMGLAIDTYVQADRQTILALKEYAEMVFASVPFGLAVLSPELTVLSANRTFLKQFGLTMATVRGRQRADGDLGLVRAGEALAITIHFRERHLGNPEVAKGRLPIPFRSFRDRNGAVVFRIDRLGLRQCKPVVLHDEEFPDYIVFFARLVGNRFSLDYRHPEGNCPFAFLDLPAHFLPAVEA